MTERCFDRETVRTLLEASGLRDYGAYPLTLARKLEEQPCPRGVVAALNNRDTDGCTLQLLRRDPMVALRGLKALAVAAGAEEMVLVLPEFAQSLARELSPLLEAQGILLEVGLLDCRAHREDLVVHIVTAVYLADLLEGKPHRGYLVSVNGGELQELPGDTPLTRLVGEDFKALQIGYTLRGQEAKHLTLEEASPENGVLRTLGHRECVVEQARQSLLACCKQSCGKCVFCREGLTQLEQLHRDLTQGRGKGDAPEQMEELGRAMAFSCLCSMGQRGAEQVLAALARFREEYNSHLAGQCPAQACPAFTRVYIDPFACTGCGSCMTACPADAIDGISGYIHIISDYACTGCGRCLSACPVNAVVRTSGRVPKLPDRFLRAGKFHRR